jgi:hypothetical protein
MMAQAAGQEKRLAPALVRRLPQSTSQQQGNAGTVALPCLAVTSESGQAPPFRPPGAVSAAKDEAVETAQKPAYAVLMAGLGLMPAVPETGDGRRPVAQEPTFATSQRGLSPYLPRHRRSLRQPGLKSAPSRMSDSATGSLSPDSAAPKIEDPPAAPSPALDGLSGKSHIGRQKTTTDPLPWFRLT